MTKQLQSAMDTLNAFEITVTKKSGHFPKLSELQSMMQDTLQPINRYLFDEYDTYFTEYKKAVTFGKKSDADKYLRLTIGNFKNQLQKMSEGI